MAGRHSSPGTGGPLGRLPVEERDETIQVKENGVEIGREYFPGGYDASHPRPAYWRNNLTALSQHRNLYFVAFEHQIYVYQPSGRGRALAPKPAMIVTPVPKNPRAPGYITRHKPHVINAIRVEDLGHEEILLLATDSGNVAAYRTERIFAVIEEAKVTGNGKPTELGELVDCFFSDWVGQSAWGLAVHKAARMIAVSSNSWCITVFAFALVGHASVAGDATKSSKPTHSSATASQSLEWTNVSSESQYSVLRRISPDKRRACNIRFTLVGHKKNIPNIGFLNCDLDPEGDWLISTDISNKLMMFNIWEYPTPVKIIDVQQDPPNHPGRVQDNRQLGWNVLALDPRSFRPKATLNEACGGTPRRHPHNEDVYDLSALAQHIRSDYTREDSPHLDAVADESDDSSDETFSLGSDIPSPPDSPKASGEMSYDRSSPPRPVCEDEASENESDEKGFGNLEGEENVGIDGSTEEGSVEDIPSNSDPNPLLVTWPSLQGDPPGQTADSEFVDDLLLSAIDTAEDMPSNDDDHDAQEGVGDDDYEPMDVHWDAGEEEEEEEEEDVEEEDDSLAGEEEYNYEYAAFQYGGSNGDNSLVESLQQHSQGRSSFDEIFPDISSWLSGAEDLERAKPPFADFPILHFTQNAIRMFPHPFAKKSSIILRDALVQDLHDVPPNLEMVERFNIVNQISELGIVLAASQKGRVGIFSLTEHPDGMAFRLDHIIPSQSQEREGDRPLVQIAGMAVGPVENHLIPLDEISSSSASSPMGEDNHATATAPTHSHHSHHSHSKRRPAGEARAGAKVEISPPTPDHHEDASLARQEQWHGIEFSRRYRLLIMYANLTIMHYELFYDWPTDMMGPHGRLLHEVGRGSLLRP
ncbi:hypothetical protein EMPG_13868 [Blastomyces silverae]|uniref:Uncharacterized protein n=1 Tax=Blastomyces silverae TaxID=2060906 RepID=A0A0H1BHC5_9EURO|nr:hypothetical protein EMPG_13868 [Blastomyces silverae]